VVDAEVGHVPRRRRAAAGELGRDVEDRHERKLHPTPAPGLVKTEETGPVQVGQRVLLHLTRGLGAGRALPQHRRQLARAPQRLLEADVGESASRHARVPAACGMFA
jgi:hypothetical protein